MFGLDAEGPVQIAYAVDDVVAAASAWAARGAGPFFVREHIPLTNVRIHAQPAKFDHSAAYGQWGDMMVELICEHHLLDERVGPASGVHHLAFFVPDLTEAQATLSKAEVTEVLYGEAGATSFAMHADPELNHLIEIYVGSPPLRDFYDMVRSAAEQARLGEDNEPVRFL